MAGGHTECGWHSQRLTSGAFDAPQRGQSQPVARFPP